MSTYHVTHGYRMSANDGAYAWDTEGITYLWAVWSKDYLNSFRADLSANKWGWFRNANLWTTEHYGEYFAAVAVDFGETSACTFGGTRAWARKRRRETTTRYNRSDYVTVRLSTLMFLGKIYVLDAREVR